MSTTTHVTGSPSNPLRFFAGAFVLNLPERTDRLAAARRELQKLDGEANEIVSVAPGVRATESHGFPSVGAYGCFRAHLSVLKRAAALGLENVLVIEDDIRFEPTCLEDWLAFEQALQSTEWDILSLGFRECDLLPSSVTGPLVPVTEPLMLAHCYAVNGPTLPKLIAFLEELQGRPYGDPRGGPMHYDGALFHFCRDHQEIVRLRPLRSMAGQRSSRSDIAKQQWFDRLPVVQSIFGILRSSKERLFS